MLRVEETVAEADNIDINQLVEAEAILIGTSQDSDFGCFPVYI